MSHYFGLLNIYKPAGKTSRWVVDQVQRLVKPAKAGHAGTLDPLATGVLMVCVGQATRLIDYVQQMPKRYRGTFLLGRSSPTEDTEGLVTELPNPPVPTRLEVETAAAKFIGEIEQRPPAFSALKVSGQRAYKLARKGQTVELQPRPVTIHWLQVMDYSYPELTLELQCSSGTYVRSLGRDLAESLGTAAIMSRLKRTAIGKFLAEDAVEASTLTQDNLGQHLLAPQSAVDHLSAITLDEAELQSIFRGLFIVRPASATEPPAAEFAALDGCGKLAAILHRRRDGLLGPVRNFLPD
ncbi:MAG TPA: tRNA pseudouridine(55) synthase TruB [Pirellulales bacterium]|nr:tRNA pseudouridine(55) synthase TruB [Pirellulales bacterium]